MWCSCWSRMGWSWRTSVLHPLLKNKWLSSKISWEMYPKKSANELQMRLFWDAISLYYIFKSRQGSKAARQQGPFQLDSQIELVLFSEVERTTSFSGIYVHRRWWSNKRKEKKHAAAEGGGFGILRCLEPRKTLDFGAQPWRKFGELTKVFVDHSWFILILEPFWFAAPFFFFFLWTLQNHPFGIFWTPHNNLHQKSPVQSRLQLAWSGLTRLFRLDDDGAEMVEALEVKVVVDAQTKGYPLQKDVLKMRDQCKNQLTWSHSWS